MIVGARTFGMQPSGIVVYVKSLTDTAVIPETKSERSAGWDLVVDSDEDIIVNPHETKMLGTGIAMEIPEGYWGGIYARSGISSKQGLRPANCVGVIDSDYRGEIIVPIHNDSDTPQTIKARSRVAQFILGEAIPMFMVMADELSDTKRGDGGFGSSGV